FLVLFAALLIGCDAGTPAYSEADKEPGMFSKRQKQTYVISSPMEGALMKDGKPLTNTKIVRSIRWTGRDDRLEQEFMTDEKGRFSLPVHEEKLSIGRFTEFACTTFLEVVVEGRQFDIWFNSKFHPDIYAETEGRPLADLVCDLGNEEVTVRPGASMITTVCRWKDMPEESEY
ncbi:MAG: DUF6795 domain-containing protein, partial [Thiohalomonadaceae bacterium]